MSRVVSRLDGKSVGLVVGLSGVCFWVYCFSLDYFISSYLFVVYLRSFVSIFRNFLICLFPWVFFLFFFVINLLIVH